MVAKEKLSKSNKESSVWSKRILKYILIFICIFVALFILAAVMKIWFVYSIYSFYLGKIVSIFGLDLMLSMAIAVFVTVISILLLPWIISFLFFGQKKMELVIVASIAFSVCSFALYYGTSNVFFDRATGKSVKYYIKTIDGFKFSSTADYNPKFGIKYKPITSEIIKEYYFWKKTGKLKNIPPVQPGRYFDMITGEPIVWYAQRSYTKIELFPLPGYDPLMGKPLKPITKDIVRRIGRDFKIYGETYSSSNDERYRHSSFNVNIDEEIFGRGAYNSGGKKLKGNSIFYDVSLYDPSPHASITPLGCEAYLYLGKVFFFRRYTVLSLIMVGNEDNSKVTIYPGEILLTDSLGARHRLSKMFFMNTLERDYRIMDPKKNFLIISINEKEKRILFMVFERLPRRLLKKGRIHLEKDMNIDFEMIEKQGTAK